MNNRLPSVALSNPVKPVHPPCYATLPLSAKDTISKCRLSDTNEQNEKSSLSGDSSYLYQMMGVISFLDVKNAGFIELFHFHTTRTMNDSRGVNDDADVGDGDW